MSLLTEKKMPTLEELLAESVELEKQKRILADKTLEINNAIQAAKKAKELEKVQLIIVEKIEHEQVIFDTNGTPRTDILEILRATPSKGYNHFTFRNSVSVQYWNNFTESISKQPNVQITYLDKNEEYLKTYFTEKLWKISKNEKVIVINVAKRNVEASRKLNKIPSCVHNTQMKAFTVPFSEGWRVIQVLPLGDDVEYTEDVLDLITKQVEQRNKMDEVALNKNADIPNPFTGINPENGKVYELKPFQKAGVFFAMAALGIAIPIEKKKEIKPW